MSINVENEEVVMSSNEVAVNKQDRVTVLVRADTLTEHPITKEKIFVICESLYYKSGSDSCVDYFSPGTDEEYDFVNETVHEWYRNPYICCEWNKTADTIEVSFPKVVLG